MSRLAGILILLSVSALWLAACSRPQPQSDIVDLVFGASPLWDDGQAEVAFYRLHRTRNQYGEAEEQEVLVGTYLVKHDYDPVREAKARSDASRRVETFKYALFYEMDSGSYQFKRNYVVNARRSDLRPMKASFTSFDWCSNQYREIAISPRGEARFLMRSDDYGNAEQTFDYSAGSYPPSELPLIVRAISLDDGGEAHFRVLLENGETVAAEARLIGSEAMSTAAGDFEARRIEVRYDRPVPSVIAEESDSLETYWIAFNEERMLLRIAGASGRYEMELVEYLRSPYWDEDIYDRLERIRERP